MSIVGTCSGTDTQGIAVHDLTGAGRIGSASTGGAAGNESAGIVIAGGNVDIGHGAFFNLLVIHVVQADPTLFGQTPSVVANLLGQGNLHLVASAIGANLGIVSTCAGTDIQNIGLNNRTNSSNLLCICAVHHADNCVVSELQCDPAAFGLAPGIVAALLYGSQSQLLTLVELALRSIVGAGANTVINVIAVNSNNNGLDDGLRSLVNRSSRQACGDINPTAAGDLAPLDAVGIHILSNNAQLIIAVNSLCHGTAGRVVNFTGCGSVLVAAVFSSHALNGAVSIALAVAFLPTSIQLLIAGGCGTQSCNASAALFLGIPTQETVAALGNSGLDLSRLAGIISLNGHIGNHTLQTTVKNDILVVCGRNVAVNTVQIQICLAQTALDQAGIHFAAGLAELCHSKNEIIAGSAIDDSTTESAILVHPVSAQIVCKENQCVKLVLGQSQRTVANKGIDRVLERLQILFQQFGSLCFRDAVSIIISQVITGHTGTITNGPLAVVIVRIFTETLKSFDQVDTRSTGLHCGCSRNAGCCNANQTQDNN